MSRAGFLQPLLESGSASPVLVNVTRGTVVAGRLDAAFDSGSRRRGLLGREALPAGQALVIAPCSGVHTFFMRFAIDLLFVGRDGRVRKAKRAMAPWRLAFRPGGFAVIEAAPGTIERSGTETGDLLALRPPAPR